MALEAILFDLWGTLITSQRDRSVSAHARRTEKLQQAFAAHGLSLEDEHVGNALREASRRITALHDEGIDMGPPARLDLFFTYLGHEAARSLPAECHPLLEAAICGIDAETAPVAMEQAQETLAATKAAGLKTALVSNAGITTAPHLRWLLQWHGLLPHLDALIFSDEVCCAKPDRRIFDAALSQIGAAPATTAFVGDSPLNDIFGAQSVGIFAVQIGDRPHETIAPDARIAGLGELLPALHGHGLLSSPLPTHAA